MFAERLAKVAIIGSVAASSIVWQAAAQTQQQDQPYAGLQTREIKALSRQEMADLRGGRGMGLALAAELNGYPGPRHVIELAAPLSLTDEQRSKIQELFDSMRAEAIPLGQKLLSAERDLNCAFVERTINPRKLEAMTAAIADMQGKLRDTHLKYHLATAALLSADQLRRYNELRGYTQVGSSSDTPSDSIQPNAGMHEPVHGHMMGSTHGQ